MSKINHVSLAPLNSEPVTSVSSDSKWNLVSIFTMRSDLFHVSTLVYAHFLSTSKHPVQLLKSTFSTRDKLLITCGRELLCNIKITH